MLEKWQILVGKNSEISQNAMAFDSQHTKQKEKILEILHLTIHKTQFNAQSRANGEISQNAMTLIANEPKQKEKY